MIFFYQEGDNKLVRDLLEWAFRIVQKTRTKPQAIECVFSQLDAHDDEEFVSEVNTQFHTGVIDEVTEDFFPKVISVITHVLLFFKYIIFNPIHLSST